MPREGNYWRVNSQYFYFINIPFNQYLLFVHSRNNSRNSPACLTGKSSCSDIVIWSSVETKFKDLCAYKQANKTKSVNFCRWTYFIYSEPVSPDSPGKPWTHHPPSSAFSVTRLLGSVRGLMSISAILYKYNVYINWLPGMTVFCWVQWLIPLISALKEALRRWRH